MLFPKHNRPVVIITLLFVCLTILLAYSARRPYESGLVRKLVLEISAPIDLLFHVPFHTVQQAWHRYLFLVGLTDENRYLRQENDRLTNEVVQYREAFYENQRLQRLLGLQSQLVYKTVAARVIGGYQKSALRTILIDQGTTSGIRKDLPVVTDRGVVGRVIESTWHVSRVLLLTDGNSNIDAILQSDRIQGVLQGAGDAGCTLKYVSKMEDVKPGDVAITSGQTTTFPKGLILGVVALVRKQEGGLFQRIEVVPTVDYTRLEEVLVLLLPEEKGKQK
jgi:rod shape-determining protein MreC